MIVTTEAVESVVLGLFTQFRIHARGRLDPADLEAQWPATRLRATDLDTSVRALVSAGALRWVDTEEGFKLELTASGDRRRRQQSPINRVAVRDGWRWLRDALPSGRSVTAPHMRRQTDHPPAA